MKKIVLLIIICLAPYLNAFTSGKTESNKIVKGDSSNAIFRLVDSNETIGTCFGLRIEDKIYILTAAHNVNGIKPKDIQMEIKKEKVAIKNYIQPNPDVDIALLFLSENDILDDFIFFEYTETDIKEHQTVECIHFSFFDFLPDYLNILSTGNLIAINDDTIFVTMNAISRGASGSPLFLGNILIGITTNRIMENQTYTGVIYGVPAKKIIQVLLNYNK